jgi:basic membrane lipoprotein Med (substrate-binding protein (PBP1-ABC) superfamily)
MKKILSIFTVSFALVFSSSEFANTIGVVYDSGGKFDKSINDKTNNTSQRLEKEHGSAMI